MNLLKTLKTGRVLRYHNAPIHEKQRLDSHQWEVAVILSEIHPVCSGALLFYALTHDCGEGHTGDPPYYMKKESPQLKKIYDDLEDTYVSNVLNIHHPVFSTTELLAVKHADVLSGVYFTHMRIRAGEQEAKYIADHWDRYYESLPYLSERSREVYLEITL